MPRAGDVYSLPAGYEATTGQTILASQHNPPLEDIESDLNAARPISTGGTGATSAAAARTALAVPGLADNATITGDWTFTGTTIADLGTVTTIDIDGGTADGVVIGGTTAAAGTFTDLVATGDVDLGDAATDTISFVGRVDTDILPLTDDTYDLGSAAKSFANGFFDGVLNVGAGQLYADGVGGNLGLGTQSPEANVHINISSVAGLTPQTGTRLLLEDGSGNGTIEIATGATATGGLAFTNGTALQASLGHNHNVSVTELYSEGTLSFAADGTSNAMDLDTTAGLQLGAYDIGHAQFDETSGTASGFEAGPAGTATVQRTTAASNGAKTFRVVKGTTENFYVEADGDVYNTNGTYGTISDGRVKNLKGKNVGALDRLRQVDIQNYERSDLPAEDRRPLKGPVAQELEKTHPDLVEMGEDGLRRVNLMGFVPELVSAFGEMADRIEALEARVAALEAG